MIQNKWYVVLKSKEVRQKPIAVKRLNENLLFWCNETGKAICFVDHCSNGGVAMIVRNYG